VVPRPTDGLLDEMSRLHAVDGLVYNRVDVLHAVADPVESRRGRPRNSVCGEVTRVGFEADLGGRGHAKDRPRVLHQVGDLLGGEVARGAAAPVDLRHVAGGPAASSSANTSAATSRVKWGTVG